jgi:hypothetical protein
MRTTIQLARLMDPDMPLSDVLRSSVAIVSSIDIFAKA